MIERRKHKSTRKNLRIHPIRRQWNEAFCDEFGNFSIGKFLLTFAQIGFLGKSLVFFDVIILHWDSLALLLVFFSAPHLIAKIWGWKLSGGPPTPKKEDKG